MFRRNCLTNQETASEDTGRKQEDFTWLSF